MMALRADRKEEMADEPEAPGNASTEPPRPARAMAGPGEAEAHGVSPTIAGRLAERRISVDGRGWSVRAVGAVAAGADGLRRVSLLAVRFEPEPDSRRQGSDGGARQVLIPWTRLSALCESELQELFRRSRPVAESAGKGAN